MKPLWTAHELVEATGGTMPVPFDASGVSIDTRTLAPGDLFVALVTETGDGHAHLADASTRGAPGALVHVPADGPHLRVEDTLAALHRLGGYARARFAGRVAAITGSVGKTTVKEMLRLALEACGPTHAATASYNNHWGVPLTLARCPADAAYAVAEIGMNHAGEIAPLARLVRPHVAVITAITGAHIGHLGSLEAIADEKASILSGLEPGGIAILPKDTPYLDRLLAALPAHARAVTFGHEADAALDFVYTGEDCTEIEMRIGGRMVATRFDASGLHNALAAAAALAAAHALGADVEAAARGLAGFSALPGRGARRKILGGQAILLDESYNASPASMEAALTVLRMQQADRYVAVLGDMLELGEGAPAAHAELAVMASKLSDIVFTCGPLMKHLSDALHPEERGGHAEDSAALAPMVRAALRPGDAVLVKGSAGSRMGRVVAALADD